MHTEVFVRNLDHRIAWLDALRDDGILSPGQYQELRLSEHTSAHPLEWLGEQQIRSAKDARIMGESQLLNWLATRSGIALVQIDPLKINLKSVAKMIPMRFAHHHQILALSLSDKNVTVACANPFHIGQWHAELSTALDRALEVRLVHPKDIRIYLDTLYPLHHSITHVAAKREHSIDPGLPAFLRLDGNENTESHAALTNRLLRYALERGASDIHLEPRDTRTQVRLRIDGILYKLINLPSSVAQIVNHRLQILAHMDTTERRRPQDGRLRTVQANGDVVELRLSTMPTTYGEKVVLRLLDPKMLRQDKTELGMSPDTQQHWQSMLHRQHGLILVTGPTGSGKTTTLYNTLYRLDSGRQNICTIEDPIEIVEPCFNQTQVRPDLGLDFAAGIRALMRQDPDIIMVGEIRDTQTAKAAIQAALTGHQVFASMHTDNSIAAILRLAELGVPDYLIRATVIGVLNQRLLPRLCSQCKHEAVVDQQLWHQLCATPQPKLYSARGCAHCRYSGIDGRVGIFETLFIDTRLRTLIGKSDTAEALRLHAKDKQWRTLQDSALAQLRAGTIGIQSALGVLHDTH